MFFNVTRHGGLVSLRVALSAVAYLAPAPDGCALRLIGGETIRVNEDEAEIERRMIEAQLPAQVEFVEGLRTAAPVDDLLPECTPALASPPIHPAPVPPRSYHHSKGRRSR